MRDLDETGLQRDSEPTQVNAEARGQPPSRAWSSVFSLAEVMVESRQEKRPEISVADPEVRKHFVGK